MKAFLLVGLVFLAVLVGGGVFVFSKQNNTPQTSVVQESQEGAQSSPVEQKTAEGYSGNVIAGSTSSYLEFNKADYEKALAEGKTIFLEFFANWCPICRAQAPALAEGFNSLNDPNVVGFRVNYNDSETDEDEKNLAKQLNVSYQHTHVILKNGKEVYRSQEQLTKEDFIKVVEENK